MVGRPIYLAGILLTDKAYNCFALMDVMKKAFKPKGILTVRDWGAGLIIFSFEREDDMDWAVRNQPWHFDNNLFLIKPLTCMEHPSQVSVEHASLWVRVYDVPLAFQTEGAICLIAANIGRLECYETPSLTEHDAFIRFKVQVDAFKPLLYGSIKFGVAPVVVHLKFESLPLFCFCCGVKGITLGFVHPLIGMLKWTRRVSVLGFPYVHRMDEEDGWGWLFLSLRTVCLILDLLLDLLL
ncbi:hypothetical protein ACS0TY_011992 [Phlomoides rotata]